METPQEEDANSARERRLSIRGETEARNYPEERKISALRTAAFGKKENRTPPQDLRSSTGFYGSSEVAPKRGTGVSSAAAAQKQGIHSAPKS